MLIGNAAAPRWWELNGSRLDQYLGFLVGAGATSAELVLHHGPIDDRGARVHVVERDWLCIASKMQAVGLACQLHASLDRRFDLAGWSADRLAVQAAHRRLLDAAIRIGERQAAPVAYVFHATSGSFGSESDGVLTACQFLEWATGLLDGASANVILCPELRAAQTGNDRRWDRSRTSMANLIASLGHPSIGICWDLGHDWENRLATDNHSTIPDERFLNLVRHVHVHDAGKDGALHHPLGLGPVPWSDQLAALQFGGYSGAVTMEIRYRYALAVGEPWTVLAASYRRLNELFAPSNIDAHGRLTRQ